MARAPAVQETEALPEADRLEGFPHPRETRVLLGQVPAERALREAFANGRMHHAWLLAGRQGIGKATLAYRLARHVLARPEEREAGVLDVAAQSVAARQVGALSHPGLLVLRRPYDVRAKRFAASIPIDEVRRLRSFFGLTGAENAWRVVIVDSADELNPNAANALLKSLEEPPPRALFLLVASEPSRLLATIRSRCRRLDLAALDSSALRQATERALAAAEMEAPADWGRLETLSEGSVRRALQLAATGGLDLYEKIEAIFTGLPEVDWTSAHALSDSFAFGAGEQRFEAFYDLFLDLVARLVRVGATGKGAAAEVALARRLIGDGGLAAWAALWETSLSDKIDADLLNLDRKALIMRVFANLETVARGREVAGGA